MDPDLIARAAVALADGTADLRLTAHGPVVHMDITSLYDASIVVVDIPLRDIATHSDVPSMSPLDRPDRVHLG